MGKVNYLCNNLKNSVYKQISIKTGANLSRPLLVSIQPNERCNARCIMCDSWKEKHDCLNSVEIINVLKQLREFNRGEFFVQIAGGEPLIFNGIYDIFKFCSQNNIICKISTNGLSLTEKNCDKIIESGLPYLSVSLDSHLPEIHDKYRGVENTLKRAVKGIEYLSKHGNLTLGVSSILMKDNAETFAESIDYFLSLPIHRLLIQPIRIWTEDISIDNWKDYKYWVSDTEKLKNLIDYILVKKREDPRIMNTKQDIIEWYKYFDDPASLQNKGAKKCGIGYDRIGITYKGDVTLGCSTFGYVGNIKEENIDQIWTSSKAQDVREKMLKCNIPCTSNCFKELSFSEKVSKMRLLIKSGLFSDK